MTDLPPWWAPPHDEALARGVLCWGLEEWQAILGDPGAPFAADRESYLQRVRYAGRGSRHPYITWHLGPQSMAMQGDRI